MTAEGDSGFFAFRVPALPMSVLTAWGDGLETPNATPEDLPQALEHDRARLRRRLREIVGRPDVQGALSVASPDLLDALRHRGEDPGVEAALVRYVSRMSTRPTPYGLFAACGVGVIDEHTEVTLPAPATWHLHTQLDADYLDAVVQDRWRRFRDRLTFRPNDSLHLMGGRWRYVESRLDGLERSYHLLQVTDSQHLQRALEAARPPATIAEVTKAVATAAGVDDERAARFCEQLVDAQVLVPTLAVTITGPPPLDTLIADLESLGDDEAVDVLGAVRDGLAKLDREGAPAVSATLDGLAEQLGRLPAPLDRSRLFHAQLTVPTPTATLARSTVDTIARAVDLLRRVAPPRPPTELDAFRDAFLDRYDQAEVPLLEALDEELGVGLGTEPQRRDPVPLLDGLRFPGDPHVEATLGRREARLLEILHRAWTTGAHELALTAGDVDALGRDDAEPLPAAVGATAVLARTQDGLRIVVTGASGPSGARLLGRFCHSDPQLEGHVRAHLRAEEALDPEAVHAEIVHLPTGRLVNVLARPVLRGYELEWLGRSGAPPDRVLTADDLLLSVRDDRFVLRSRTLGRRVLPRLTSAHNYGRRSPGVYRFLAAVQADGCVESVGWTWFPFHRAPFTPRLRRGPVVLALARWLVDGGELKELDQRDPVAQWQAVAAWRDRRRLPRWITLVEDDNVLAFDMDNPLSVDTFVRAVRHQQEVVLQELFPGPDELVASGPDGERALEVVVPLVRRAPVNSPEIVAAPSGRRTFPPGSEWTYLKLYTGSATADRLLREAVGPCARQLVVSGAADHWFFLRYDDPGFHLRIRVHGDVDLVRPALDALAARAIDEGLAHDAVMATYQREIERYGGDDGILVAERLFHADSEAVVDLLDLLDPGAPGLDARWRIGLLGADRLLRDLGLDEPTRADACRRMRTAFEGEMGVDADLRRDVGRKVRAEHQTLDELLGATADGDHPFAPAVHVLDERSARIAPLAAELAALRAAGRLTTSVEAVATSFVHMWLNRLCRSESRRQEYVTYALLARLHEARAGAGPVTFVTPADVLSRTVFTIDGHAVDWAAVVEAARAWGEWAALEPSAAPVPGAALDDAAVRDAIEERATALRYDRRLLSADETQEWLAHWGVKVADWLAHIRRQVVGEVAPDPEGAVWIEAVVSGTLERTAWRLARSLTAHRALGGSGWPTVGELDQAMNDFADRAAGTRPTDDDPQTADRARHRLVAEALHQEMARRVHWHEHVPPRSERGTEAIPDDAMAEGPFDRPGRRIRRFPTVWAVDEMDCGAACLAAVCRYFGRAVPLPLVRDAVGTALDGTSLRGLVVGAERLGLAARAVKASPSRLDAMPLPAICHWQGDHWVVLHDTNERFVRVCDPVAGPRRIPRAEWLDGWSGFSCLVAATPALADAPEGRPPWRWLLPFVRPHRRAFAGAAALALGAATLQMLIPVGAGLIVDEAITGGDRRSLHLLALGMLGLLVAAVGAGLVQRWLLARLAVRFDADILDHVTDRLLGLPAAYFASRRTGDIERRLSGLRQVRVFLVQQGVVGLTAVTQIVVALTIMVVISRRLSLVYVATVPLYVAAMVYSRRRLRPLLASLEEAFGRYHSRQIDAIRGIETVKARGAEHSLRSILRRQFDSLAGRVYRADVAFMRYDAAVALVLFLTLALVVWVGGLLVLDGELTIGALVAFNGLVLLANGPVGEVLRLWDEFQYASVLLGRLDDVLAQEPEQGADRSRLVPVPSLEGRVSIQGLTVRTGGSPGVTILDDVTLDIEPGETVALVGFSGAGKTTLARCLLGLLPPTSGRILYDGQDLDTLDHRQLRQRIGYVLQDDHLFDDTLAANIALGADEIDREGVRWAAGVADAAGFIDRLPLGYETRVGETGVRLSGGQAQRVAIARAVYRRPAILILDEATSSLDADSERAVQQGIDGLLGGRTQIVIAHRLSTVRDADRIVVLDRGRIAEQGKHAELLERRGLYWYMASQQVGD